MTSDGVGPWFAVRTIMNLRDAKKSPDRVTQRVRNCVDQLAQREMELKAKLMLLGL